MLNGFVLVVRDGCSGARTVLAAFDGFFEEQPAILTFRPQRNLIITSSLCFWHSFCARLCNAATILPGKRHFSSNELLSCIVWGNILEVVLEFNFEFERFVKCKQEGFHIEYGK